MVARLETNLLPLCLCAQRTAGGVDHQEKKREKMIVGEEEVEIGRETGDHQGIDPAASPLCTINRGTPRVGLKKKKGKANGEESPPLLMDGH